MAFILAVICISMTQRSTVSSRTCWPLTNCTTFSQSVWKPVAFLPKETSPSARRSTEPSQRPWYRQASEAGRSRLAVSRRQ